ncbi:MAG: lytic transglycosylase domain-containing protein [Actinomycetota bacterium]|nr:lytic transglycosylase domain-containing protein [Actinomycetota bacterium]
MERSSLLAPHRLMVIFVVLVLAIITVLFVRGPGFVQRLWHPIDHVAEISDSSDRHELNPYLVCALIEAESDWRADIISPAGAVGLMQVLPATTQELRELGLVDPELADGSLSDPAVNIEYGTAYLRLLVERYHEVETALAAYNAGMGNVDEWVAEGVDIRDTIEFPETRHYVVRVVRARDVYTQAYPELFPEWSDIRP